MEQSALILGGSSEIAQAIIKKLLDTRPASQIVAVSRGKQPSSMTGIDWYHSDYEESAMADLVQLFIDEQREFDQIFICHGVFHDDKVSPEKRLEDLDATAMLHIMNINAVTPALWLKHLLPILKHSKRCHIAVFSARVGSIGDNHLGGWYSYRASKSALNMLLRSTAIEYARRAPKVKLLAFHPGTTDTDLSRPFSQNVPEDKLFSPGFVADQLLAVLDTLSPDGNLSFLDWNHQPVSW